MNISCSRKGIFLSADSVYSDKIRSITDTTYNYDTTYLILNLTDKYPFSAAISRDRTDILAMEIGFIATTIDMQRKEGIFKDKKGYFVISCDDKYIYYGFLKENNSELYDEYNPIKENSKDTSLVIKTKNCRKLYNWVITEMEKGSIISIIGDKKGTYIGKLFIGKSFGVI
jgi:hypothetical protein